MTESHKLVPEEATATPAGCSPSVGAYKSASAAWLAALSDRIENGKPINPCYKALRRIADLLEAYDRKALADFDAKPKRAVLVQFRLESDEPASLPSGGDVAISLARHWKASHE